MNFTRKPIFVPRKPKCPYEQSFGYIYLLTNKTNGNKYIGKHVYRHPYRDEKYWASGGEHLKNALKNLGEDKTQFEYEILDWVNYNHSISDEVLCIYLAQLEEFYIDLFGTFENPDDYNETPGGDSWKAGRLNPMYKNHRFAGKNHPMYSKRGQNNPRTGQKHSDESKKKMSEKAKSIRNWSGENNPMYGIHKTGESNPFYGKTHTKETKEKISQSNKGKGYTRLGENNPMYGKKGKLHHGSKPIVRLSLFGELLENYDARAEAERQGYNGSSISDCCTGRLKTYKGYKWMYKEEYEKSIKEMSKCQQM